MPYARVRDIDVYYEIDGDGPPLLNISGSGADLRTTPGGSSALARHFTVLSYDQRGLGRTSIPEGPYTMADYADDAAGLLDAVGWERAHVVGISFGGMVAQHLAIRHPSRVQRLVMGCTSPGGSHPSYDIRRNQALPPEERGRRSLEILDSRTDFSADPPVLAPGLEVMIEAFARGVVPSGEDADRTRGFALQLDARAEHDATAGLAGITAPTLVVSGRFDLQAPLANGELLAATIPGARFYVADGGHLFMLQDPTAWPVIVAFLQSA